MGQTRHGSATTTHDVRAAIVRVAPPLVRGAARMIASFARTAEPGARTDPKTVAKWRKRVRVKELETGPKEPRSTILTEEEAAVVVAFRRHMLPLNDCLSALRPSIPHLTRSALHRCLQRHGVSRLPDVEGDKPQRQKFQRYPIGFFRCADLRFTSKARRCRRPKASPYSSSVSTALPGSRLPNALQRRIG